jgi:small subunit ribosomal protein S20
MVHFILVIASKSQSESGGMDLANHKSAIKRHRQSLARRARNASYKSMAKTTIKELQHTIAEKDAQGAEKSLNKTVSILHKIQSKGVIHKNNASRKISRLSRAVNKLSAISLGADKAVSPDAPEQDHPANQS